MIFVSYSKEDAVYAQELCRQIEATGVRCWMAPRDIPPGADWPAAIVDAICRSSAVAVLVSHHGLDSRQIPRELAVADAHALPLIPVRIEHVEMLGALEYWLIGRQWVDWSVHAGRVLAEQANPKGIDAR